jgi:translocation and assembly module TamA
VLCLLCAACASKQRNSGPVVTDLSITGAQQVSPGEIEDRIVTSEASFFSYVFGPIPTFDPTTWTADLRRIERFYQSLGFYQAEVVEEQVVPDGKGGVRINLRIDEGKPTHVTAIDFEGLEGLPKTLQTLATRNLGMKVGQVFREADWTALKAQLKSRLREMGFADAEVGGQTYVEVTDQTARVHVIAAPGPRLKFGSIFVTSGRRSQVSPELIIAQVQGSLPRDAWFSESALARAQSRVFQMGVFGAVKVTAGTPNLGNDTVPIIIDVRAAPFHTVRYGGGVGIDPARQEIRAIAEYTDRNFLGGLRKLSLKGKVGWAFLPAVWDIQYQGLMFDLVAQLEQPNFFAPSLKLRTSVNLYKQVEDAYGYFGGRAQVGVAWKPWPNVTIYPSYNFELDQVNGQTTGLTGDVPILAYGCPSGGCLQLLSYLEQSIEWDARDDVVDPKKGFLVGVSFQESGAWIGSGYTYTRIFPEIRGYVTVGAVTFAAKLRVGTILQPNPCTLNSEANPSVNADCNPSPIVNRFFSGGAGYNRGFGSRQLSPLLPLANEPITPVRPLVGPAGLPAEVYGRVVPIGGNGLLDASLEVRWNVAGNLVLAFFVDAGFVSYGAFSLDDLDTTQVAVGIGLRYRTPIGLLRVDIGYRLNIGGPLPVVNVVPRVLYDDNTACFGIGTGSPTYAGAPWSRCAFHFAVGESF